MILGPPVSRPRRQCGAKFVSPRRPGVASLPATGLLQRALMSQSPRPPRRLAPLHPEASVDLETSLWKGTCSICEVGRCGAELGKKVATALRSLESVRGKYGGLRAR